MVDEPNTPEKLLATRMVDAITQNTQILAQVGNVMTRVCNLLDGVQERYGVLDFLQGVEDRPGLVEGLANVAQETGALTDEMGLFNRAMEILKDRGGDKPNFTAFCRAYFEAMEEEDGEDVA
jgi:hypothetical protein